MSSLTELWQSLNTFQDEILSVPIALLTAYIIHLFRPKVKVIWGQANNSFHKLKSDTGEATVYTQKHFIQNLGKQKATNIEVVYSSKPTEISLFEEREYNTAENPNGNFIVKVPSLAPKELLIVDSIFLHDTDAKFLTVNCAETTSKKVDFTVNRQYGKIGLTLIMILMFFGLLFPISIILQLLL